MLQGERHFARDNKLLGNFRLKGIRRAMAGVPQIEVTFSIDANGIVNVSARDLSTGKMQDITISGSSNMSEADIRRAMEEAQQFAEQDRREHAAANARNRAEQLLYAADRAVKQGQRADSAQIREAKKRVQHAMRGKDQQELAAACDALEALLGADAWANTASPYEGSAGGYAADGQEQANDDGSMDAE